MANILVTKAFIIDALIISESVNIANVLQQDGKFGFNDNWPEDDRYRS